MQQDKLTGDQWNDILSSVIAGDEWWSDSMYGYNLQGLTATVMEIKQKKAEAWPIHEEAYDFVLFLGRT